CRCWECLRSSSATSLPNGRSWALGRPWLTVRSLGDQPSSMPLRRRKWFVYSGLDNQHRLRSPGWLKSTGLSSVGWPQRLGSKRGITAPSRKPFVLCNSDSTSPEDRGSAQHLLQSFDAEWLEPREADDYHFHKSLHALFLP